MRKVFFHLLFVVVAGLIAYSNTFSVPFQFDDVWNIAENPVIQNLDNFTSSTKGYEYNPRRVIGYLTFAVDYHIGGSRVAGYHAVNLAIHLINALLVYFLVLLTFRTPYFTGEKLKVKSEKLDEGEQSADDGGQEGGRRGAERGAQSAEVERQGPLFTFHYSPFTIHSSQLIALFSALLFVVHPIQTQAVTYIVQRFTSLATMFYLFSVVFYAKGRLTTVKSEKLIVSGEKVENARFTISIVWYLLSLVSAALAMRTKEITFTLPVVIVLCEFIFFKSSLRKKLLFLLPVLMTLIIIPVSILGAHRPLGEVLSDLSEKTRVQTNIPRLDYLITQIRVVTTYIRLIFLPVNQNLDYEYPVYRSLLTPSVFLSFLFLLALFGTAVYLLYKAQRAEGKVQRVEIPNLELHSAVTAMPEPCLFSEPYAPCTLPFAFYYRLIAFGILWFFVTLSVESSVIPIADVIFEHRVYLPSAGAFIALTAALFAFAGKFAGRGRHAVKAASVVLTAITLILTAATYARNRVWQDGERLWQDVVKKSPGNARAYNNLGYLFLGKGRVDEAIGYFGSALKLNDAYADAHTNLGVAYYSKGWTDRAIGQFQSAIRSAFSSQDVADAHHNLGLAYVQGGMLPEALAEFEAALMSDPGNPEIFTDMGVVYKARGDIGRAIESYRSAIALKPDYAPAYFNLGVIYAENGMKDRSAENFRKAHYLDPARF